jgi:hypothetical protein
LQSNVAQSWSLYQPCGVVNLLWSGGKVRSSLVDNGAIFFLRYQPRSSSYYTNQHRWSIFDEPLPSANVWHSQGGAGWKAGFGDAAAVDWSPADYVSMMRWASATGTPAPFAESFLEFGAVTVYLNAGEVPLVTVGAEDGNYTLAATITNQATGDAITVSYTMDVGGELEIDTDLRTVMDLADGSGQFQAVSFNTARRTWLRLLPGSNTLRFDDVGTNGVKVTVKWEKRYY